MNEHLELHNQPPPSDIAALANAKMWDTLTVFTNGFNVRELRDCFDCGAVVVVKKGEPGWCRECIRKARI